MATPSTPRTDTPTVYDHDVEAEVRSDAARWRLADVVRIAVTGMLLTFLVGRSLLHLGAAVGVDLVTRDYLPRTNTAHVGDIALLACFPLAIWWTARRRPDRDRPSLGLHRPTRRHGVITAAVLCTILLAVKLPLALYGIGPGGLEISFTQDPQLLAATPETLHGWGLLVSLLSTGVLVAIGEELTYRAVLFGWLRRHLTVAPAIVLSSAVFAATHGLGGITFAFFSGLVLAWLYHRSGSLWPGIAVHAVNNATTVLLLAAAAA